MELGGVLKDWRVNFCLNDAELQGVRCFGNLAIVLDLMECDLIPILFNRVIPFETSGSHSL